jgi:hypothetical protein
MHAGKIATAALLLTLGVGSGCALGVQRTADAIRRQQNGSEPGATGADSRKRKGKEPWRPVVHTAAYDAADGLVDGALDAAKEPGRQQQLRELGDGLETRVGSVGKSAGAGIVDGINEKLPETRPVLVELVQQLRAELGLDPEQTGRKVMRGALAEARTGVAKLRPEVHRLLEEDVVGVIREAFGDAFGPGLKDRVRDDIKPAIDELGIPAMAQDVGKQTALGFSAGMAEALAKDGQLGIVLDERMADAKATAGQAKEAVDEWLARGLLLALVIAVIVIVIVVFWWLKERNEKLVAERARTAATEEGERRERMLRLVTGAIKHAGERDSLSAFREEIKRMAEQAGERETAAALSYFLTREGLKLDKPRA